MRKTVVIALVAGILGIGVGFGLGIFFYPFWFLDDVARETVPRVEDQRRLAEGNFIHPNPADPVHWGRGSVHLLEDRAGEKTVYLLSDFTVGPGPRFHVYLVDRANIATNRDFETAGAIDLGRLRAFQGSQVYPLPSGTDIPPAASVVIWCKEFGVLISPATLRAPLRP